MRARRDDWDDFADSGLWRCDGHGEKCREVDNEGELDVHVGSMVLSSSDFSFSDAL